MRQQEEELYNQHEEGRYWFISVVEPVNGRLVVLGEYPSREDATNIAYSKLAGQFEVFAMPTKDRGKATQHAKYVMFHRTANLEQSIRRAKHRV